MICDLDDFHQTNHRWDLITQLKEANPAFKVTLFAVPGLGSEEFWRSIPDWCELAVHGWLHPDPYECSNWTKRDMNKLLDEPIVQEFFVEGFKAPGWQISDDCYEVLLERGYWVADQHLEDGRRPKGLRTYFYEDGEDRWHGHIQNVCDNGLQERWGELLERVRAADQFLFASEALSLGSHSDDPR